MSVIGIGKFWEKVEPGWKLLTVLATIIGLLVAATGYALDIKAKADRVPGLERMLNRIDRNIIRLGGKLDVRLEEE